MENMFCKSLTATQHFARQLSTHLKPSDVVALVGNLSAGKTTFVKALAQGLGVGPQTPVTSPTFTIIQEYPGGRFPLFHIDFYRLEHQKVLEELGLEEYFGGAGVTVVEWADRFPSVFPARRRGGHSAQTTSATSDVY